jgi:peptidoglycan hydrolase-like protein with peptidoglycan-binding domain
MRAEFFCIIALSLLVAACSSGDQRSSIGGQGRNGVSAVDTGEAQSSAAHPAVQLVRQAQSELKREGLYRGEVDGVVGPETKQAIAAFRQREGLRQTTRLDQPTMQRIYLNALRIDRTSRDAEEIDAVSEGSGSSLPPSAGRAATPTDANRR